MATTTNNGWETPDDSDPFKDGALAMRTLGSAMDTSVGTGLLAWQTYAPTLSGGWVNGNGVYVANYCQIGKTVHVRLKFTVGSTTTRGTDMRISMPVTASTSAYNSHSIGTAVVGGTQYPFIARGESTTVFRILILNASATYLQGNQVVGTGGGAVPTTWNTGDAIEFTITYQAA
jgi:hypothetical protein